MIVNITDRDGEFVVTIAEPAEVARFKTRDHAETFAALLQKPAHALPTVWNWGDKRRAVAQMMDDGLTAAETAKRIGISRQAVYVHRTEIMKRRLSATQQAAE